MSLKKLEKITDKQIAEKGVQSLADRPNLTAQYGTSGLSATQLKLWFDQLATFLAKKINDIQDTISGEEAAQYIRIMLDDYDVDNLDDLVSSLTNGSFAGKILKLYPSAAENALQPLQSIINEIAREISKHGENIANLWEESATDIETDDISDVYYIYLYNNKGEVVSFATIPKMVGTDRLFDSAVETSKLKNASVTTEKLANKSVTTEKLADKSVTTAKIVNYGITNEKIAGLTISTEKLANKSVTTGKIADKAITTEKIDDASVTNPKIAAGSVSEVKLSTALINRLLRLESEAFTSIQYDAATGKLIFTAVNGSTDTVDLPLELIVSGGHFDDTDGAEAVVLTLANGDEIRIPLNDMLAELIAYMDGIRKKIYDLQEAPPLSALSNAIVLCTPTLAQLAALS